MKDEYACAKYVAFFSKNHGIIIIPHACQHNHYFLPTEVCSICKVTEICVEEDENGNCITKDVKNEKCCTKDYDQQCKEKKQTLLDSINEDMKRIEEELDQFVQKLAELTKKQMEMDRETLNPTP